MVEEKNIFSKVCKYCKKVITGYSEKQVEFLLMVHKLGHHPDKVEIVEKGRKK